MLAASLTVGGKRLNCKQERCSIYLKDQIEHDYNLKKVKYAATLVVTQEFMQILKENPKVSLAVGAKVIALKP